MSEAARVRYAVTAGLLLLIGIGGFLRLRDLDARSITHLEMYVPGIPLPPGISEPSARMTLAAAVKNTLSETTYPPAYYALMWGWTKCFGSSIRALRLPSAICGIACIPLVFLFGALTGRRAAAWIAALLVSVNGYLVFWDQFARSVSLATFLGLLATDLLLLLTRDGRGRRWLGPIYVLVLILGASTHVFFWALIAAHLAWAFSNAWARRLPFPAVGELQILALILASPLLAFAVYQSRVPTAELSADVIVYARELVQFSFLFPLIGFSSGVYPRDLQLPAVDDAHLSPARWAFVVLSLGLFVAGLAATRRQPDEPFADRAAGASPRAWFLSAGAGTLTILFFVVMARALARVNPGPLLHVTELMAVVPFAIAAFGIWLKAFWVRQVGRHQQAPTMSLLAGRDGLVVMLAIAPFALLAVFSQITPILNVRGMTMLGPYILMVLAVGLVRIGRRVTLAVFLAVVLGVAHVASLRAYHQAVIGRADYKTFAQALTPLTDDRDLFFVKPSWYVTPIFYYMRPAWPRFVGDDYLTACRQHPRARVWTLLFYRERATGGMTTALSTYTVIRTIDMPGARAVLYEPVPAAGH